MTIRERASVSPGSGASQKFPGLPDIIPRDEPGDRVSVSWQEWKRLITEIDRLHSGSAGETATPGRIERAARFVVHCYRSLSDAATWEAVRALECELDSSGAPSNGDAGAATLRRERDDAVREADRLAHVMREFQRERDRLISALNHEERALMGYHEAACAIRQRGGECDCETEQYRHAVASKNIMDRLFKELLVASGYTGSDEDFEAMKRHVSRASVSEPVAGDATQSARSGGGETAGLDLHVHAVAYHKLDMKQTAEAPIGTTTPYCACGQPCGPARPRGAALAARPTPKESAREA